MNTLEAIYSRRTIRKFNGESITKTELDEILKSAYASPIGRAMYDTLSLTVISNKELLEKWEAWKRLGVLVSEMEASTIFTVAASLGLSAGAVFHVIWNQERANAGLDTDAEESHDTDNAVKIAIGAIKRLISVEK